MEKGDYFYPTGMTGKKLLSKYFKDQKYTAREKEQQWLLCTSEGIVWVVGQRCDRRFAADAKTEDILLLTLNEK
ncbi:MAG: tRNA lysidine(34) synthetase TilS C-terminal domain-containing protein, partial [Flavobacteriaceae bacterium]